MDAETMNLVVKDTTDRIDRALHDVVIPNVKEQVLEQKKMQFDDMGANTWDSTVFPTLKQSTIRKKRSTGSLRPEQPLYDTGELQQSLYMSNDDSDFDPHFTSPHGNWSNEWLDSKGAAHPFDKLTEAEEEKMMDQIVEGLVNALG